MVPLSPRQLQILMFISNGFNNEEIAKHLGLAVETIKAHRKIMRRKMDAVNTANMVAIGLREGIIE